MLAIARALSILSFQDETNLTGFVGVFTELERLRHESLRNANTVELTPAKLPAETVHSDWSTHSSYYSMTAGDANTSLRRRVSYT